MSSESVRVAVRVRPFNARETERGAKCIIEMKGQTTKIVHPNDSNNTKTFNFDYSYWSHDGFKKNTDGELTPDTDMSPYGSQKRVFDELGQDVLQNALEGYNCSLFAYGQTGSGKSYSMVGYDNNKGIVPIICDELFKIIESRTDNANKFAVSYSMLEIYNERVRDLLKKSSNNLEVRQSEKLGFYVQDLEKVPVGSFKEIEKRINQGTANRTIAATQMNATSSRAHTVITVEFKQIITSDSGINTKSSSINLIDLAGSERADSTGATGDRLKEGANINKSLSALGNVIAALADISGGKKNVLVPYRDSVLTKMLKNALGGNSKTIMIAALSPADINYDETLSTLRYADRAKRIKNMAIVNENPMDKLIKDLRAENEKLKKMLNGELPQGMDVRHLSEEEIKQMKLEIEAELRADMRDKSDLLELHDIASWNEKVREAEANNTMEETSSNDIKKQQYPYLSNLNEDSQLSGVLVHFIDNESMSIGKNQGGSSPTIKIGGPGIQDTHAILLFDSDNKIVTVKPHSIESIVRVNGNKISSPMILKDLDRVLLGSNNLYIFHNPLIPSNDSTTHDWESAQVEIAAADGFGSQDISALELQIVEILPLVNELNAISMEMSKNRTFNVFVISPVAQDVPYGEEAKPKVMIKMVNNINRNSWLWERSKFINRRYIIQEMYQRFVDGEQEDVSKENDPFWEPTEDVIVGHAHAFLQNMGHHLGMEHSLSVLDYKGLEEGLLSVNIEPCNATGEISGDDSIIDDPNELLGEPYYLKITIVKLSLNKSRFIHGSKVKFRFYREENIYITNTVTDTLEPEFNYSVIIGLPSITKKDLQYFKDGLLMFCVCGIQKDIYVQVPRHNSIGNDSSQRYQRAVDELGSLKIEERIMRVRYDQQAKKLTQLKQICMNWASKPANEQLFDPFYRSVASLAFSSGKKFKVMAEIIGKSKVAMNKLRKLKAGDSETDVQPQAAKITISLKKNGSDNSEICSTM